MTLSELLESRFRGDIRFRGAAYLQAERVSIVRVTPEQVFGVVRNGVDYETQLVRQSDKLRMFCTCTIGGQKDASCKHLWATILAVDEGKYLTAPPRPGYFPPFASDTEPFRFDDDLDEQLGFEPDFEAIASQSARERGGTDTRRSEPRVKEWETRLGELRQSLAGADGPLARAEREREILYRIDVERSRAERQLVLATSQRQRRANGQWGKLKPLKLRVGRLDEIEHAEDRRILAYLSGGAPDRVGWPSQGDVPTMVSRYVVPFELCEMLLPMMCRTGRVCLMLDEERQSDPLEWDAGEPWQLRVSLAQSEEFAKLEGRLERGDVQLPLGEVRLAVPGGLIVSGDKIARLEDFGNFPWLEMLIAGRAPQVPRRDIESFVDALLDLPGLPRLDLPEELRLEEVRVVPVPRLLIKSPRPGRWKHERVMGEVQFEYLNALIRGSSEQSAIVQRDKQRCLVRDHNFEARCWAELETAGFQRLADRRRREHDVDIPARDLGAAVRQLVGGQWQIHADGQQVRQPGEMKFRVTSGIDWFELHADVDFDGRTASFPELLSALSRGDSTVRLDDGSLGILPEEWLKQYGLLAGLGVTTEDHVRFSNTQAGLLDALLATQNHVQLDARFEELRSRLQSFQGVIPTAEPEGFHGHLRGYQREGIGWLKFLQDFRFGGCLADDMGLGKTVQLLALLLDRVHQEDSKNLPSLIVVPKSLLFNWIQESARFTPELRCLEYIGLARADLRKVFHKHHVILTTYGTLRRDIMALREIQFDYVVLDEAQTIKNSGSQVAKSARLLKANHRLALSGTPIENHLGDLWSIFEFLNPGMLGRSSVFRMYANDTDNPQSRELLARGLRPFILRRSKQEVASELPEKFEQTIYCRMGREQVARYNEMRDHYRDSLLGMVRTQGLAKSRMHVLEALLRLRQAACHPGLLDDELQDQAFAKLDVLIPHLQELIDEGHKALVFSQFTSMLSIVRHHLDKRGVRYEYLDGQTRDRKSPVERFQNDPELCVFLISLKAGGLGLNLTAADYVFLLDPWWNPAVEMQAIDRAHRVGQTRQVFAYRLICRGTVEEKIAELQRKKKTLADAILEESGSLTSDLTTDDLEMLLS